MSSNHADNNQGVEPDTRTIARQAVEAEFRKNKKRGYDSSDDEAGGGKKQKAKSRQQQQPQQQNKSASKKTTTRPIAVWEVKYRDRAKERREGKNPAKQEESSQDAAAATLGGTAAQNLLLDVLEDDDDGENDKNSHDKPMVRGLDRTLIEKDQETQQPEDSSRFVANRSEALEWLSACDNNADKVHSTLGRALLPVLQQQYLPTTVPITEPTRAGLALQRSTWILDARPNCNVRQAWQVPRQEQAAAATTTTIMTKISPMHKNQAILQRMQRVLDRQRQLETHAPVNDAENAAKAPIIDSDEDIFAVDDDDNNDNDKPKEKGELSESASTSKKRTTFFFSAPSDENKEGAAAAATQTAPPVVRLERLSQQVDHPDYQQDVDFDGRIEEEEEGKKKKKRRRKKKDDDSD